MLLSKGIVSEYHAHRFKYDPLTSALQHLTYLPYNCCFPDVMARFGKAEMRQGFR